MWNILVFVFIVQKCESVIYQLNDTEYDRMPALYALDQYDRCLRYNGTYCLARLDLHAAPNNDLMKIVKEYSAHTTKHYNHTYIERGICVTESCKKFNPNGYIGDNLSTVLEACVNDTIWADYGLEAKLSHVYYCDNAVDQTQADALDWMLAAIFIILMKTTILGSTYDIVFCKNRSEKNDWSGNQYLLSFSIFRNWNSLVNVNSDTSDDVMFKVFCGFKSIGTFIVILAHVMLTSGTGFTANPHDFEKSYDTAHYQLVFNSLMMVQVFFMMSGFLMVYHMQKAAERMVITWNSVPKIIFMRWWRITPAYAVMLAYTATWPRLLGSGPLWKLYVGSAASDCRRYWWLHLLYIQNYVPDDRFCALHAWYLAADIQLFICGLVIYMVVLSKGRILGFIPLMLLAMLAPALHVWLQDLDGLVVMNPEIYRTVYNDTYTLVHIRGHNNLPCFLIGMVAGYLVHRWQKKGLDLSHYKVISYVTWCIPLAIVVLLSTGRRFYADEDRASLAFRMVYAATHRLAFGLMVAFFSIAIIMKWESRLRELFEWHGWTILSKLSYSVFLVHMCVVHALMGSKMQLSHVSTFGLTINQLGVMMLSYGLALPLYLLVESPANNLLKVVNAKNNHQRIKNMPSLLKSD